MEKKLTARFELLKRLNEAIQQKSLRTTIVEPDCCSFNVSKRRSWKPSVMVGYPETSSMNASSGAYETSKRMGYQGRALG